MRALAIFIAGASIFAATPIGAAQAKAGDSVARTSTGIMRVDYVTRQLSTLAAGPFVDFVIGDDNDSLVAIAAGQTPSLQRIGPFGAQTTLATLDPSYTYRALLREQDGSYLLATDRALLRSSSNGLSVVSGFGGPISDMLRDDDTGDALIVMEYFPVRALVYRRSALSGAVTSVAMLSIGSGSLAHDQRSGQFYWAAGGGLLRLDRTFTGFASTVNLGAWQSTGIAVDQPTSLLLVACRQNFARAVLLVSRTGAVIATYSFPTLFDTFSGVRMWGSRRLTSTGTGDRGSTCSLRISLPRSPGAGYCCALSFAGLRPGIRFGANTSHIRPDALFANTMCGRAPSVTSGFIGILNASGSAVASFQIPNAVPIGTVYTAAALAVNPTLPASVDITESISIVVTR